MTDEKLTPERAVRLLRAKGAELENVVLARDERSWYTVIAAAADIALIAQLLADHIERTERVIERLSILAEVTQPTGNHTADECTDPKCDEWHADPPSTPTEQRTCLAARWKGHPMYAGPHDSHLFSYGLDDMYTGNCAGWPSQ